MNSVFGLFRLSQLPLGVSRTSIRHGSTRSARRGRREPLLEMTEFEPGHGEQIWVWSHMTSKQVVYSHTKQLDSNRAMRQLPFNGKKTKPAKLRRDYWRPMALIQLPVGAGAAGQAVFQKLREFRRLHELQWDDSLLLTPRATEARPDAAGMRYRTRFERGVALNDQRANAIADMAAALAGVGRGSRMRVTPQEKKALIEDGVPLIGRKWAKFRSASKNATEAVTEKDSGANETSSEELVEGAAATTEAVAEGGEGEAELVPATIYWANDTDRNYARKWSDNVTHELFDDALQFMARAEAKEVTEEKVAKVKVGDAKDETEFVIKEAKETEQSTTKL